MIENISITSDSEYGYHVYVYYSDYNVDKHEYDVDTISYWTWEEKIDKIFEEIINNINEIKEKK